MHLKTDLPDGTHVSTIFPMFGNCWETCVFKPNGDSDVVEYYDSANEAAEGHDRIVASLTK